MIDEDGPDSANHLNDQSVIFPGGRLQRSACFTRPIQFQIGDILEIMHVACDNGEIEFERGRCDQKIECSRSDLAIRSFQPDT